MKKRILSIICSMAILCTVAAVSTTEVEASENEEKIVDGSALTMEESSTGYTTPPKTRGEYLMTGECTISKAGLTRVYAYASTTANREVDYIATLVYVERYYEDEDIWGQVDWWVEETHDDYFLSTAKSVKVDRGYYYRVRANHLAGDQAPYDETASFTNGIYLP
ncbi:hypothetical protein H6B07_18580 [Mediterraneibacter glycyrrhizinilyticus]|nr:DUF6147 family protein [Mediterraneibacter glycyrrhizinilyticus]MBM6804598.1 hypothetical protein [Mediterraneibacter glycyrrhizinilyticus]